MRRRHGDRLRYRRSFIVSIVFGIRIKSLEFSLFSFAHLWPTKTENFTVIELRPTLPWRGYGKYSDIRVLGRRRNVYVLVLAVWRRRRRRPSLAYTRTSRRTTTRTVHLAPPHLAAAPRRIPAFKQRPVKGQPSQ